MKPKLALQLYTVREILPHDFAGTVEKIAAMGYAGVETAFFDEKVSVAEAAQIFKSVGLAVPSAHCELPLGEQRNAVLDMVGTLGAPRLIWHGWPRDERYGSVDGIKQLAEQYNEANAIAKSQGLIFGLHNHWWEFEPVEGDTYPYRLLLQHLEPDIFFEIDTYWVKTAGLDPVKVVAELGGRVPILHIKDGPAVKDEPMVAVGEGSLDVEAIAQAASVAKWMVVELDRCATDMLEAVEKSYAYLTQHGLAEGKRGG